MQYSLRGRQRINNRIILRLFICLYEREKVNVIVLICFDMQFDKCYNKLTKMVVVLIYEGESDEKE